MTWFRKVSTIDPVKKQKLWTVEINNPVVNTVNMRSSHWLVAATIWMENNPDQ